MSIRGFSVTSGSVMTVASVAVEDSVDGIVVV